MSSSFPEKLTAETLASRIDFGDDVEFELEGRKYTILGWYENGPLICDIATEACSQFSSGEDLINKYLINGHPLKEYIPYMKMN